VTDFNAPSSVRALAELEKPGVRLLSLKAARWLTPSDADAEDLLSDAIMCVCDPVDGRPWDPARGKFTSHMRIVMHDLRKLERERARTRREIPPGVLGFDADAPDPQPQPDEALDEARGLARLRRLGGMLRERIGHNARTLQVFDHNCQGVEAAEELSRLIGCSVAEVYDCNRQIAYHANHILAEEEQSEATRMKEMRESAKKTES
jgi:hypothetical protein